MQKKLARLPKYEFGLRQALLMLAGAVVALLIPMAYLMMQMMSGGGNAAYQSWFIIVTSIAQFLGPILAFDYLYCRPKFHQPLAMDMTGRNFVTFVLCIGMLLGIMAVAETVTSWIPTEGEFFENWFRKYQESLGTILNDIPTSVLLVVVLAPVLEEIVFRGIILKGMLNRGIHPATAITVSAMIFGLVHGNLWQFVGAFMFGVLFGLVYYRSKSLLLPVIMHAVNNGSALLLYYYTRTESFAAYFHISPLLYCLAGLLILGICLYFYLVKLQTLHQEN